MSATAVLHVRPADWAGATLEDSFDVVVAHGTDAALAALDMNNLDCVVLESPLDDGDGIETLRAVRERASPLPILFCTERPDGTAAAAATRNGATEYVPRAETAVVERVRALFDDDTLHRGVEETSDARSLRRTNDALEALAALAARDSLSRTARIRRAISIGRERLDLPIGYLTRIDGDTEHVEVVDGPSDLLSAGMSTPLSKTYCRQTIQQDGLLAIADAEREGWGSDPTYETFGVSCYLGGTITVDEETYGTLCFASLEPRDRQFSDAEQRLVRLLVEWVGNEIERDQREQELLRYETAVENVNDMVYVLDEAGRFQLVTQPLASYLGFEREEMLGASPARILDDEVVAQFEGEIQRLLSTDTDSARVETELVTAEGNRRPVETEISLLPGEAAFRGTVGVVRDLTELKATRERLHEEQTRFSYLFDALPDPVVETELVDDELIVHSMNPAFAETFDLDPATVSGHSVSAILRAPDGETPAEIVPTDGSSIEPTQEEIRRRTAEGFRDFLFRGVPYQRGDGRRFAFGIYTDITEQRERQRRLEVLNRVLRHNLRNDMTVVLGVAEELRRRCGDAEQALIDTLLDKAEEVVSLSDRAREIESAVRREGVPDTPVSPSALVESVLDELVAEFPDATVRSDLAETPPVADAGLRTAIYETIENALEHNEAPTVDVSVSTVEDSVEIGVSDDGDGIPDNELVVVTGDVEITQLTHGTGLGLWLITWLVESYGGTATFDADDGTTVSLRLPRADG